MPSKAEIQARFWSALKDDMTMMVGLDGIDDGHARPMTAQLDGERSPIWFFTSKDNALVQKLGQGGQPVQGAFGQAQFGKGDRAIATFASKGHDIFATVHGRLSLDNDRATIDKLWNRFVAAWFEGGKDDPNLQLLRFEPGRAQIWLNDNSLFAGVKLMLGRDPKTEYQDKVGEVRLS